MKQRITTPPLKNCICGSVPEVRVASLTGWMHYDKHWCVECGNCKRVWPRNTKSKHRAICKWNNKMESMQINNYEQK